MAKRYTRKDYQNALLALAGCIRQDMADMAKDMWKSDPDLRDEYESYAEYLEEFISDQTESEEGPVGYDLLSEITVAIENLA